MEFPNYSTTLPWLVPEWVPVRPQAAPARTYTAVSGSDTRSPVQGAVSLWTLSGGVSLYATLSFSALPIAIVVLMKVWNVTWRNVAGNKVFCHVAKCTFGWFVVYYDSIRSWHHSVLKDSTVLGTRRLDSRYLIQQIINKILLIEIWILNSMKFESWSVNKLHT